MIQVFYFNLVQVSHQKNIKAWKKFKTEKANFQPILKLHSRLDIK